MTDPARPPFSSDLNALALEALDLWQEHLTHLANDPKAKQDLAQLMEPSRRLFAEWMQKVQTPAPETADVQPADQDGNAPPSPAVEPAPVPVTADDGTLRLAQLALHVADLERRVGKLESRRASRASAAPIAGASQNDN